MEQEPGAMVQTAVAVFAVVATGVFAGLFFAFSIAVMPGLARTGDRVVIEAMQGINAAILNPLFALVFLGAPVSALASVVLYTTAGAVTAAWWFGGSLAALVLVLLVTFTVNVPRNNALDQAGPGAQVPDPGRVRADFERLWVRWNHVRTVLSVLALVCSAMALNVR